MALQSPKEWMVRTRNGDVLGPFTQRELMDELKKNLFTTEDEICPNGGYWISAQALSYHDSDEFTKTSTRTHQSYSGSITTDVPNSDQTPTPEARVHLKSGDQSGNVHIPAHLLPKRTSHFSPIVLVALVVGMAMSGIAYLKVRKAIQTGTSASSSSATSSGEGESPFVRQIYGLIHAGKTQSALRQLTLYHERGPSKNDVEYLIPYAALLILEGESPSRATKFLDQVLESEASAYLKSRAHLWLGYLALSTDKPDQAESHFLECLQLTPKDAASRFNLGRTYLKQEKYSLALDYLQLAELEAPDLWLVQIYKGRAKFALDQPAEAKVAFKAAVEGAPDRWITYIYYALFLAQNQNLAEAQKVLKTMLTRDPHYELHNPPPFGFFQEKLNYTEYLNAYSHVMEKYSGEEKEVGKRFVQYLISNSDENRRLEAFAANGGLTSKVLALKVTLDRESTAAEIKKALQRLPENLDAFGYYAYVLRGEAQGRLGLFDEAKKDFRKAIELSPQSAVARWAYSALLQKLQENPEAQRQVRDLLKFHPGYIPAIVWTQNL